MKDKEKPLVFKGTLSSYYETGMEYTGFVIDPVKDFDFNSDLLYKLVIEDGDSLIIFDKNDKRKIVWKQVISFRYKETQSLLPEHKYNQPYPKGIKIPVWKKYIKEAYPAKLIKGEKSVSKK